MPVSLSCARHALRRIATSLVESPCAPLLKRLQASGVVTEEEAQRVAAKRTDLEKAQALVDLLCEKPTTAAFQQLRKGLALQGLTRLADLLTREYQEALKAAPDVTSQSYKDALMMADVPGLPHFYLPRDALARSVRDDLMMAQRERRFVVITGGPGMGKTLLVSDVVRNEEFYDHFKDAIIWINIGPNSTEKEVLHRLKRRLKKQDTSRTLLILDDLCHKEILSTLTDTWKNIRVIITSRDKGILSGFEDKCVRSLTLKDGFTFLQCRQIFCRHLKLPESDLPLEEIDELCFECEGWPLGICTVAQLVACDADDGRSVEEVFDKYLSAVKQKEFGELRLYSDYAFEDRFSLGEWSNDGLELSQPLLLSISQLTPLQCECVTSLAALVPEQWISIKALTIIWSHLDIDFTQELRLEQLLPSSLIVSSDGACGQNRDVKEASELKCRLHSFFRSILHRDIGENALLQLHKQIVSNYEEACSATWGKLSDDGYIISNLCHHLEQAGRLNDVPKALSDFFFVEKMFKTCGLSVTLDTVRRYSSSFVTEYEQHFRDNLISALENIACLGRNPNYQISFAQTIFQLSPANPLVQWTEAAIRRHPQLLSEQDSTLWRSTTPKVNRYRRHLPDKRFPVTRSLVTNDTTYEAACISLDVTKKLLLVITVDNQLFVCDADNFDCRVEGYRIPVTDTTVRKTGVTGDNRRLILLTDDSVLLCGHLRFTIDKLCQFAPHGNNEEIPLQNILTDTKVQNFVLQGDRLAVMDSKYNVLVFDLHFDPSQEHAPVMRSVFTTISHSSQDSFERDKIAINQLRAIFTDLETDLRQATESGDMLASIVNPQIYEQLKSGVFMLDMIDSLMSPLRAVRRLFPPLKFPSITWQKTGQMMTTQVILHEISVAYYKSSLFVEKDPSNKEMLSRFSSSKHFWYSEKREISRKKMTRLSQALMPPKIDMAQSGTLLAISTNLSSRTVKILDITTNNPRTTRVLKLPAVVTAIQFVNCSTSSKEFLAVAYQNVVGIWDIQDEVGCQQIRDETFVFNVAIEQNMCVTNSLQYITKWQLSLPGQAEPLATCTSSYANREVLIANGPILHTQAASLGHLRTTNEPLVGCIMSILHNKLPGVAKVGGKLLVLSAVNDNLILLDPQARSVLFVDTENKVKYSTSAACDHALFAGGERGVLVKYNLASNGRTITPELLSGQLHGLDDITALEYSPRGNLLIGLSSGAILRWSEGSRFQTIAEANGRRVFFLIAFKKRSGFVSVSADKKRTEIRVWKEDSRSFKFVRSIVFDEIPSREVDTDLEWMDKFRPTLSADETFIAMLSLKDDRKLRSILIANLENGEKRKMDETYTLEKILFHPKDDQLLLVAIEDGISLLHVRRYLSRTILQLFTFDLQPVLPLNERIESMCIMDSDHLIITTYDSVTMWKLSEEGNLSQGRLILAHGQVRGKFLDTYVSRECLLCVTSGVNGEFCHRACYPLIRSHFQS